MMTLITISTALDSLLIGLITSVVFLLIGYFIQSFRYWYHLKRKFHNKLFNTYWKRFPNDIMTTVTCKVIRNTIKFSGNRLGSSDIYEGLFIMNPINLKAGEGFHTHTDSDGFAFIKIIIKDNNTFLIEAHYTGVKENDKKIKIGFRIYQAYIWRKK